MEHVAAQESRRPEEERRRPGPAWSPGRPDIHWEFKKISDSEKCQRSFCVSLK
ncbi:hypothetical protein JYU34_021633 [Plutella xylostella]|uniref:Uncharacterized protein n=1 Tax=Plutella xylostella TaxID=51655 RepID=A0ABQ7PR63_PLUXY|nr:hypothetical protein JYU34_021633 [Plutella xylostella]